MKYVSVEPSSSEMDHVMKVLVNSKRPGHL